MTGVSHIVVLMRSKRNGHWFEIARTVLFNDWNMKAINNVKVQNIPQNKCSISWSIPFIECLTSDFPVEKTLKTDETIFQCSNIDPFSSCRVKMSTYGFNDKLLTSFFYMGGFIIIIILLLEEFYINNVERDKVVLFAISAINDKGEGPIKSITIPNLPDCQVPTVGIPEYSLNLYSLAAPMITKINFTSIELTGNKYRLVGLINKPSKWPLNGIKSYSIYYEISNNGLLLKNESFQLISFFCFEFNDAIHSYLAQSFYIELNEDDEFTLDIFIKDVHGFDGAINSFKFKLNSRLDFLPQNSI